MLWRLFVFEIKLGWDYTMLISDCTEVVVVILEVEIHETIF